MGCGGLTFQENGCEIGQFSDVKMVCYLIKSGRSREMRVMGKKGCAEETDCEASPSSVGGIITTEDTACGFFEEAVVSGVRPAGVMIISVTSGSRRTSSSRAEYRDSRLATSCVTRMSYRQS